MSVPEAREALLRRLYDAHTRRDIEAALAGLTADVAWPNVAKGIVLHGRDEVRAYWTDQFASIDPHVEPRSIAAGGSPDEVVVRVHQVIRSLDGALLRDGEVTHVFTFRDDLVCRMSTQG